MSSRLSSRLSPRLGARLIAVLVPAALLLPGAAHAERVVTKDAAGDVVTTTTDLLMLDTGDTITPAPDNERADIVRTVVNHRTNLLEIAVTFRDVRGGFGNTMIAQVKTPQGKFMILSERHGRDTYTLMLGRRDFVECGGLLSTVDPAADRVTLAVPTACIDNPRWVQVGVGAIVTTVEHDLEVGDRLFGFIDDAHSGAVDDESSNLVLGPRVHRG